MRFTSSVRRVSRPWIPYDARQFRSGVNAAIKEMSEIAIELTSGTTSTAELRQMGHPFSRRRPQGFPRLPINKQSGELQNAIRIVRRTRADGEEIFLQVNSPHAGVLSKEGLKNMVPRGFVEEFARRTRGILVSNVQRAFRKK